MNLAHLRSGAEPVSPAGRPGGHRDTRGGGRGPGGLRELVLVAVFGTGAGLAVVGVFALASYRARIDLCVMLGLAVVAVWRLLLAARPGAEPVPAAPAEPAAPTGGFADLSTLEYALSWGSVDRDRFESRLRPLLVRLAEDRLRQRHGVSSSREPDRARDVVGERLWQLMTGPPVTGPLPTLRQLAGLLGEIERI